MIKLSNRLSAAAAMVTRGSRLCDVGTDHGYVPVYLLEQGIIISAVACDINTGPLNSCIALVNECGLNEKIKCVLSNGLEKISESEIDDILIAGMGGELIADILSACPYAHKKHLILNPMTHPEVARKWLYDNGFDIVNDIIVCDGKHHYNVFDAVYSGNITEKSTVDYYLGNIKDFSDTKYFTHLLNYLENKQKGGGDYFDVINAIKEKL
ncbi:MAG: class I SAM-dependent methyltransferase [Eubacterium sp.]